ncbi:MAG: hypothetical protein H6636_01195 [Anaerolineales bacterium]|nr:hypothetical protein [Anaerolineales bacterium]
MMLGLDNGRIKFPALPDIPSSISNSTTSASPTRHVPRTVEHPLHAPALEVNGQSPSEPYTPKARQIRTLGSPATVLQVHRPPKEQPLQLMPDRNTLLMLGC